MTEVMPAAVLQTGAFQVPAGCLRKDDRVFFPHVGSQGLWRWVKVAEMATTEHIRLEAFGCVMLCHVSDMLWVREPLNPHSLSDGAPPKE